MQLWQFKDNTFFVNEHRVSFRDHLTHLPLLFLNVPFTAFEDTVLRGSCAVTYFWNKFKIISSRYTSHQQWNGVFTPLGEILFLNYCFSCGK